MIEVPFVSRKHKLLSKLSREMEALQRRWAVLLKRKSKVLAVQKWRSV